MITTALVVFMSLTLIVCSLGGGCVITLIIIVLVVDVSVRLCFVFGVMLYMYDIILMYS
jgi:hypothetical protein